MHETNYGTRSHSGEPCLPSLFDVYMNSLIEVAEQRGISADVAIILFADHLFGFAKDGEQLHSLLILCIELGV